MVDFIGEKCHVAHNWLLNEGKSVEHETVSLSFYTYDKAQSTPFDSGACIKGLIAAMDNCDQGKDEKWGGQCTIGAIKYVVYAGKSQPQPTSRSSAPPPSSSTSSSAVQPPPRSSGLAPAPSKDLVCYSDHKGQGPVKSKEATFQRQEMVDFIDKACREAVGWDVRESTKVNKDKITLTISTSPLKKQSKFDHDACAKGLTATVDSGKFFFRGDVASADTKAAI
ncbi:MAG: hypothetical protein Q9225_005990 [Loekoesia sp. 1 TL-2023]